MTDVTRGFCSHQNFVPWDFLPLTCGYMYIHLLNHGKMYIKSEVEEILFKLETNDHSEEAFLLTKTFGPNGLSAPTRSLCTRATENRFFAGSDRFIVCKTDSICIKRIFFGPKKTHFADHILAQFPGLVKCQTVNCPQLFQLSMLSTHYWIVKNEISQ